MKNLIFILTVIALIVAGGWAIQSYEDLNRIHKTLSTDEQLIAEGQKALDVGRYADAKRIFNEELKLSPDNAQAAWGLKKAQVWNASSGSEFKALADALYEQDPNDGHVNLFLGQYYAANHDVEQAGSFYRQAIELMPKLAEAYYALGLLNEQQSDMESAKINFLKAIAISPEAKYHNSLARTYAETQRYELAIKEYGKNVRYPLSLLESATIFWRLGYLSQALNYQRRAIEFLEDDAIMNMVENRDSWYLKGDQNRIVKLSTVAEKKSYAYLLLAATLFIQDNPDAARLETDKAGQFKLANYTDIKAIVRLNLDSLTMQHSKFAVPVQNFEKLYL
jgi:tetratricopeptide (TPR) repeat protein